MSGAGRKGSRPIFATLPFGGIVIVLNDFKVSKVVKDDKIWSSLQTKTVSGQALENQQVYIWQKICLRYFKISQTYFRLCALYFQFAAGSFLPSKKNIFFVRGHFYIKPSTFDFRRNVSVCTALMLSHKLCLRIFAPERWVYH